MTASRRRGFTLVELLVVTGLMAALLGLLVSGMRGGGGSQVRPFAQSMSSAILAAQSRALANDAGSALIVVPGTGNLPAFAANLVFNGDVPPIIIGSVTSGIPPATLSSTTASGTLSPTNADVADLAFGYRVRFSGTSPSIPPTAWMGLAFNASTNTSTVSFRTSANQTTANLIWPVVSLGSSLQFEVTRYPIRSGPAFDAQRRAAIDLRYSGIGNTMWGPSMSAPIAISFDRTGHVDSVMQLGTSPTWTIPTAPLYLLIADASDIADSQTNKTLQSQSSRWLALAPRTGRLTVALNISVSGTTQDDINNARFNARQGITGGGQ